MKNNTSLIYSVSLLVGDILSIVAAFTIAYILRVSISHRVLSAHVHASTYILSLLGLLPFWLIIYALLGLYSNQIYRKRFNELWRLFVGTFIGIMFIISYSYIANISIFPARLVTLYAFILVFLFVLIFRTSARGVRRQLYSYGRGINNVLIVGDTKVTQRLTEVLDNSSATGYKIVGIVGSKRYPLKNTNAHIFSDFREAINKLDIGVLHSIIQTELYSSSERNDEVLAYAQQHHISYNFVPGNSDLFYGNIKADLLYSVPVITVHQTSLIGWGKVVKRLSDIIFGLILLIIASPFMLIIAIFIKLSDGGPVLFRHERLSRYNNKVKVFKFRTHRTDISGLEPEEAFKKMGRTDLINAYRKNGDQVGNDPRITKVGRFLRRYSMDELPQLLNVVKGDISLVGPRALVAYELDRYAKKNLILSIRSGLTGLAQISGVSDLSFEERRKLDLYYVENWTFWSDVVIMAKTFWVVLRHKGTRQ